MSLYSFPNIQQTQAEQERQMQLAIQQMKANRMMPINSTQVTPDYEPINAYELLEHCGDLLATEVITAKEWMKLKHLLRSTDRETVKLAKEIIDVKIQIK